MVLFHWNNEKKWTLHIFTITVDVDKLGSIFLQQFLFIVIYFILILSFCFFLFKDALKVDEFFFLLVKVWFLCINIFGSLTKWIHIFSFIKFFFFYFSKAYE